MNAAGYARTLREAARLLPARVARDGAAALTARLAAMFSYGSDPYGNGWAALATGGASHLTRSGAMRGATRAVPARGSGIDFESPAPANYHQSGTRRMPARRVLPDQGLPAGWKADLQTIYSRVFGDLVRP